MNESVSSQKQPTTGGGSRGRGAISIALASLVVLAVAVVSFLPSEDKHLLHTSGKYHSWGHFLAFTIVGYVASNVSSGSLRARVLIFIVALIFGFGIEIGEHLIFHSGLEWKDVLVDAIGVMAGTLAATLSIPKEADARAK